jgi:L-alanine-DL-glutamate epimerase-like enolase superfamily enzyme
MKIEHVAINRLSFPLERSVKTITGSFHAVDCLTLSLETTAGLSGKSFVRALGPMPTKEVSEHIKQIRFLIEKQNALISEHAWKEFWHSYRFNKSKIELYALAALDIAAWDLFGKQQKKPLHQMLGRAGAIESVGFVCAIRILSCQRRLASSQAEKDIAIVF